MKVVFTDSIVKKEFGKKIFEVDLEVILTSCEKGIFADIKGYKLPVSSKLVKIYSTTVMGARRIVLLLDVETQDLFFLFYRNKNDKIGQNISIKNKEFKDCLSKYLILLMKDIDNDNYVEYELN